MRLRTMLSVAHTQTSVGLTFSTERESHQAPPFVLGTRSFVFSFAIACSLVLSLLFSITTFVTLDPAIKRDGQMRHLPLFSHSAKVRLSRERERLFSGVEVAFGEDGKGAGRTGYETGQQWMPWRVLPAELRASPFRFSLSRSLI